jgi:hypothetical protein
MPYGKVLVYAKERFQAVLGAADGEREDPAGLTWHCGGERGALHLELWGAEQRWPALRLRGPDSAKGRLECWEFLEMRSPEKVDWALGILQADQLCGVRRQAC